MRQGKLGTGGANGKGTTPALVAVDLLYHISSFAKVLLAADVLEIIGSPMEKAAFNELKVVVKMMKNSSSSESLNLQPFLDKLSEWTKTDYSKADPTDVLPVWDDIVKLIMVVIPPLREVFLGQVSSALEVPGWLNLMSRCFHAHFTDTALTLEDVYLNSLQIGSPSNNMKVAIADSTDGKLGETITATNSVTVTASDKLRIANAMVLRRAPEILVISVESAHLPSTFLTQMSSGSSTTAKAPSAIRYPESFDLAQFSPGHSCNHHHPQEQSKIYDLCSVVALEGTSLDTLQSYFRVTGEEHEERWYRGAGFVCEEVSKSRVIEGNFYGGNSERRVYPRILIYSRRDLPQVLDRTIHLVSRAGQMRALGDVAFAVAMTTENYGEARRCYEEAIAMDETLRLTLQENLNSLEKIERTQKARVLEEQADLALANRRFKEASDLYSKGMMNAVVSSGVYLRVRDKLESVSHIMALEAACQFAEKGEESLKMGLLATAKEHYSQAFKQSPEFLHLHTILVGIEKTVQLQTAAQKIADAQSAAKSSHYKLANHYYREAIALVPEKMAGLQATLDGLIPLMQGEDALMKQKAGLAAMDEKRHSAAIQLFTEAISLLPESSSSVQEHALFLCDRAQAQYELKDYQTAIDDCNAALALKPELAMGHFRLGAAQFGLELYDEATASYEHALKCDTSMSEAIKVKMRQVTTAKEIQQRKEREEGRAKEKEEEARLIQMKREQAEQQRKEKAERLAKEQAEKAERNRIKEEERKKKLELDKELDKEKEQEREAEKEKLRTEKLERDAQKASERERQKLEKERERERIKQEKEEKAVRDRKAKEAAAERQLALAAELERAAARQRELEKEKEAEREKARLEMERTIAEREKARQEKIQADAVIKQAAAEAAKKEKAAQTVAASSSKAKATLNESTTSSSKSNSKGPHIPASPTLTAVNSSSSSATSGGGATGGGSTSLRWSAVATNLPKGTNDDEQARQAVAAASSSFVAGIGVKGWGGVGAGSGRPAPSATPASPRAKPMPPPTNSLSDFPTLGEAVGSSSHHRTSSSGDLSVSPLPAPTISSGSGSTPSTNFQQQEEENQQMGWSVRRPIATAGKEGMASSSSASLGSANASSSGSTDIFSAMAESPAMSTDYTFKPSEQTLKAAEAKRAAAAAQQALPSDRPGGDFSNFLSSSSSASYMSSFAPQGGVSALNGLGGTAVGGQSSGSSGLFYSNNGVGVPTSSSSGSGLGGLDSNSLGMGQQMGGFGGLGGVGSGMGNNNDDYMDLNFNSLGGLDLSLNMDDNDPLLRAIGGLTSSPTSHGKNSLSGMLGGSPTSSSTPSSSPLRQHNSHQQQQQQQQQGVHPIGVMGLLSGGAGSSSSNNGGGGLGGMGGFSGLSIGPPSAPSSPSRIHSGAGTLGGLPLARAVSAPGNSMDYTGGGGYGNLGLNMGGSSGGSDPFGGSFSSNMPGVCGNDPFSAFRAPSPTLSQSSSSVGGFPGAQQSTLLNSGGQNSGGVGLNSNQLGGIGVSGLSGLSSEFSSLGQNGDFLGGSLLQSSRSLPPYGAAPGTNPLSSFDGSNNGGNDLSFPSSSAASAFHRMSPPTIPGLSVGLGDNNNGGVNGLGMNAAGLGLGGRAANNGGSSGGIGFSSNHLQHQQGGSGAGGNGSGEGIEADILPESAFPSVAWLRQYGMNMFRWAGDSNEWTEYAMRLPPNIASAMFGPDYANPGPQGTPGLSELQSASGCKMWLDKETLMGREEPFLVFLRGPAGQSSNTCMNVALELVSNKMKLLLQPSMGQQQGVGVGGMPPPSQRQSSFGSLGNGSGTAPGRPPTQNAWGVSLLNGNPT